MWKARIVLIGLALSVPVSAEEQSPADPEATILQADEIRDSEAVPDLKPLHPASLAAPTVRFRWPLLATDWYAITAYFDLDPSAALLDYMCLSYTTNGHNGNDVAIRDFVDQDEGRFVVAAAPGLVVSTNDGEFDRHTVVDPAAIGNHVILEHADGTQTRYWHLRKWSVLVAPGQHVLEGQPLGLVGSSGMSSGPHLHFAVNSLGQDVEPHSGPCNPGPSLWHSQPPHAMDNPVTAFLPGLSTVDPLLNAAYQFRLPNVTHVRQAPTGTTTYFWSRLRYLHVGDVLRMVYLDPNGSVYTDRSVTSPSSAGLARVRFTTVLPGTGGLGTWTILFQVNGVTVSTKTFVHDTVDYQSPVAAGRTVPVPYGVAAGDLRASDADSGIKEFRVVGQPANGTVILSGPRQSRFTYTPNSGFSGLDSFTFEAEDAQGQVSPEATMTMNVSPVMASVLRLEGGDDHVAIPDNGTLNHASSLTLEARVRRTAGSAGWNMLFDRRNPTDETGFSFGIQPSGTLRFGVGDGTTATFAYGTAAVPMDRWTHVAAAWDGSMMRIYVDGIEEPNPVPYSGTISYPGSYETWLGGSRTPGESFRGEIEEMRIWGVARSASQLQQDATCAFHAGPPPAVLMGWWRFEGDAQDSSSHGNHGAVTPPSHFRLADGSLEACAALDSDLDGIADNLDNCIHAPNPAQGDADADGIGDVCDGCPALPGPQQHDSDRDGIADACDICPFHGDTEQTDSDGDGSGDLCDPAPGDAASGVPGAIGDLALDHDTTTGLTRLDWTADPLAVSYAVVRGTLQELRARHYGACVTAADPDDTDTTFEDAETPALGELFSYLVAGVGESHAPGRAGIDSSGRMRDLRTKDCL